MIPPRSAPPARPARSRRLRRSAGFSIVEVMFATAVMALTITTSITVMQHAFLAIDMARKLTLAGQIMQSEFERLRLDDWTTIAAYPATADITSSLAATFGANSPIAAGFTLMRETTDVRSDLKRITVTATWKGYDGKPHTRTYTTYYGRNGLYDYFYNSY